MTRSIKFVVAALAAAALSSPIFAQANPGAAAIDRAQPTGNHMGQALTQDQFNQLSDYADQAKRLTKEDKAKGKTLKDLLAQDKTDATALAKSMPLSCDVTEAMLAAQGPETVDGKTIDTKTYEVICANGMGYFLISQDPAKPYGFSCLAADTTRKADVAAGRKPGTVCQLPGNADVKAMLATVLSRTGTDCAVRDYVWVGKSAATNTEFNEVACTDGKGYVLKSALPGSMFAPRVTTCHDSAMQGLPCKLTESGALTLQTFKDALTQHGVTCDSSNIHSIGQENVLKRYVVEFQCPQYPKGLVAFIPLNGNTAKFETLDCTAAVKRGVKCTLTGAK